MHNTHFKEPAIGGSIKRKIFNPDLLEERAKCTFDQNELKSLIHIPESIAMVEKLVNNSIKHPEINFDYKYFDMTREEQMKWHWEDLQRKLKVDYDLYMYNMESGVSSPVMTTPGIAPYLLHYGMFQSGVIKLGTDEQYNKLAEDLKTMKIMGCYA